MSKSVNLSIVSTTFLIILALFANLIPIFAIRTRISIYISCLILVFLSIITGKIKNTYIKKLMIILKFNIYFIILIFIVNIINLTHNVDLIYVLSSSMLSFIISLTICIILGTNKNAIIIENIRILFFLISIFFIIQFVLSIYESYLGSYLFRSYAQIDENRYSSLRQAFQYRFIINSLFNKLFGLRFPLTGLLGQTHNWWGALLPFYNLIFLIRYLETKSKYYFILIISVLIASLLNTSRFAIFAIFVTDLIFYNKIIIRKKYFYMILLVVVIFYMQFIYNILPKLILYISNIRTLSSRLIDYSHWLAYVVNNIDEFIFGFGDVYGPAIMSEVSPFGSNNESLIFVLLYHYGIIGLILFFGILYKMFKQSNNFNYIFKNIGFLLPINMILISLTVNNLFSYWVYPFVTLMYIYIVISNSNLDNRILK